MSANPTEAMVLAAGLGTRMRPLTDDRPKPLIEVAGAPLIDHVLDALEGAGVSHVVVNVHYKADMLISHLGARTHPRITISDEREELMDTGGGVKKALPHLGDAPFFTYNSDFLWTETGTPALRRMGAAWDADRMDALMLLSPMDKTTGFEGAGDFFMDDAGQLTRRGDAPRAPYAWMGVQITSKAAYVETPDYPFSNNLIWDRMIPKGRLYGLVHEGVGCHVGSPEGVRKAEEVLGKR
jgi:MurNAc alpha-1-phosphate uridylyltransferase